MYQNFTLILDSNESNKCILTCFPPNTFASECSLSHGFIIELEWEQELESRSQHLWFIVSRGLGSMSNDIPASLCNYIK